MTGLLLSPAALEAYGDEIASVAADTRLSLAIVSLPADPNDRLGAAELARIDLAHFSADVFPERSRQFFAAAQGAPNLRWMQLQNVGVDEPVFGRLLAKGVQLTTSAGATAEPIGQTAIAGVLALARDLPRLAEAQRRRAWEPGWEEDVLPGDLRGQTMLVVGLGAIGSEIARIARVLGLRVIGVRRSPARPDDPVDELHPPAALHALLPRADWLVLAVPLTEETRGLIDATAIALLPQGARVVNIARGAVIEEDALITALEDGQLAGAYLDVFEVEPLPADSPLWALPNVIVTPHNSSAASGNVARITAIFLDNLGRWARGEALRNEARA